MIRVAAFMAFYLLTSAYALGRGGVPERRAAAIMAASLLLTWLLVSPIGGRFHGPEYGVAFADTAMLVALIWLALTADRFWPLWLAAMQAVVVLSHAAMIFKPVPMPAYYKNTIQLWSYPLLATLAIGTLRHRMRTAPSPIERSIGRVARILGGRFGDERASGRSG